MQTTPLAAPGPDAAELEQRWQQQGFTLWPSAGQFVPAIARVFAQRIEGGVLFRWLATPAHCNGGGIVHGGMLSTLADTWLANNVLAQLPAERRMVTTNLAVDFFAASLARAGAGVRHRPGQDRLALVPYLWRVAGGARSGGGHARHLCAYSADGAGRSGG